MSLQSARMASRRRVRALLVALGSTWMTNSCLAQFQDAVPQTMPSDPAGIEYRDRPTSINDGTLSGLATGVGGIDGQSENPAIVGQLPAQATQPRNMEPLRLRPLTMPNVSIQGIGTGTTPEDAVEGRLPAPISLPYGPDRYGGWAMSTKSWAAPVYCHLPTYYEDVMLEHHGHERCPPIQPLISGARFYSGLFFTPYLAYLHPPMRDVTNAGYFRPGSAAPGLRQRAPHDHGAMTLQAVGTATGVLALQP